MNNFENGYPLSLEVANRIRSVAPKPAPPKEASADNK
jgi:hypothetical protein